MVSPWKFVGVPHNRDPRNKASTLLRDSTFCGENPWDAREKSGRIVFAANRGRVYPLS